MSRNYFDDVGAFHEKFNLPVSAETYPGVASSTLVVPPRLLQKKEFEYRENFLHEEQREFIEGHAQGDLAKCADALADIVWIALGTAHYMGIPFDKVWAQVRASNMTKRPWKEGDPIKPRNTSGMEVVKPDGWKAPEIERVLIAFTETYFPNRSV